MLSLIDSDFGLVEGDNIYVTIEAMNRIDYSYPSPQSGDALIQIEPHMPTSAPSRGANTNEAAIEVVFEIVTADGGADIDTYAIELDSGLGFIEVSTDPLLTSPAIISSTDVTSGAYLTFRYRAHNVHGWSEYSDSFVIVASTVPDLPTTPATISDYLSSSMTF
jgi:hypothetical protein